MEAMTIMGMAASQARFLGLTARKSNVEYQGQQINQQRTALSNESANLYNQMLELTVPTPPSTNEFYKTVYTLDDTTEDYSKSNYRITNATKTYNAENQYKVTLTHDLDYAESTISRITCTGVSKIMEGETVKGYQFQVADYKKDLIFIDGETPVSQAEGDEGKSTLKIENYHIYYADPQYNLDGYKTCCKDADTKYYFYKDGNGKNYFLTEQQLNDMKDEKIQDKIPVLYEYEYTKEESVEVIATIEKASSGRFSTINIRDEEGYPEILKGATKNISTTQQMDQEAYDDAYNDYEYEKTKYEKAIADINAQTEIIQNEDQQLELRLQQLNTEQNAISTEMDSVSKVIEDNVEKTFKVFA